MEDSINKLCLNKSDFFLELIPGTISFFLLIWIHQKIDDFPVEVLLTSGTTRLLSQLKPAPKRNGDRRAKTKNDRRSTGEWAILAVQAAWWLDGDQMVIQRSEI